MKYHSIPTGMTVIKRKTITTVGEDVEKVKPSYFAGGIYNG